MDSLERIQQRATRVVKGLEHLSCEESLRDLGPFSLEQKWLRGDSVNVYKYLKGRGIVDGARLFSAMLSDRTRTMGPHRNTRGSL